MRLYLVALAALRVSALSLDVDSSDSVKSAAKSVGQNLLAQYHGDEPGNAVGIFDNPPYYWWSAGVVWDALVDYWSLTGDSSHNDLVREALLAQLGPSNSFLPLNQTNTLGNDDQGFWAMAALTAAERNFNGTSAGMPTWTEIAAEVFNEFTQRWDEDTCGGGLRWQILPTNVGYSYKNSATNGNFFQLAARLAQLTGNQTYADWAEKSYKWLTTIGYVASDGSVYDGADVETDCTQISKAQFSSNAGVLLYGAAVMYNHTKGDSTWADALKTLVNRTEAVFFKDGVMVEVSCETSGKCTTDMRFFKGILAQNLARTARAAPFTAGTILPLLRSSATAAASKACGSANGTCVFSWTDANDDTEADVGAQFSALQVIQSNLGPISGLSAAGSNSTTSSGNSTSGQSDNGQGSGQSSDKNSGNSLTLTYGSAYIPLFLALGSVLAGAL